MKRSGRQIGISLSAPRWEPVRKSVLGRKLPLFCCLLSLLFQAFAPPGFSSTAPLAAPAEHEPPRYEVSLLTFSPTDNLFEWFGHTALAVSDRATGHSTTYNFGGFSFGTDDLLMFTMGRFEFWSFAQETERVIRGYRLRGRHIIIQKLDLTPLQTARIYRSLLRAMLPPNRYYLYDHFQENCATRLRDIVDEALDGAIRIQSSDSTGRSYREHVHRMTAHLPMVNFLINFVLSDGVDETVSYWDTMFLPDRLMDVFQQVANPATGRPLVRSRDEIISTIKSPFFSDNAAIPSTATRDASFGLIQLLLLGLAAWPYVRRSRAQRTPAGRLYPLLASLFGAVYGLLGLVLFFMAVIGSHKDVYWNENFLLLNPVTFLLLPLGILKACGRSAGPFAAVSVLCGTGALLAVCLKLLPGFNQANGQQLIILVPSLLLIGLCGFLEFRRRAPGAQQIHGAA